MNKNGLANRRLETKVSSILGGIAAGYLFLCFIAQFSMPTASVHELSGRANAIDYAIEESWGKS